MNTKDSEAFVTITNSDIYEKINLMHDDVKTINGQVKTHKKLINILFLLVIIVIGGITKLAVFG